MDSKAVVKCFGNTQLITSYNDEVKPGWIDCLRDE